MKKANKILCMLFSLILSAALFGCASAKPAAQETSSSASQSQPAAEKPSESSQPIAAEAQQKFVVGLSNGSMNHPHRASITNVNKKWADDNLPNVEVITTDGQNNAAKQIADVEDLIARGVDLIMISPLTSEELTGVVKRAMDAGIMVVTLDRKVNTPVTLHIGAENKPIGVYAAKFLNEKLSGKGNIIEIQGTAGASATIDRHEGFEGELTNYPDLKVIGTQNCDYLREPSMKFMEDMLQRFGPGEIQAVYAHNDEEALGAVKAIEAAGRSDEIIVVGVDGEELAIEAVRDGKMALTITYPFCAPEGMQNAYKLLTGEKVPEEIILENKPIDASNVDQWIGKGF